MMRRHCLFAWFLAVVASVTAFGADLVIPIDNKWNLGKWGRLEQQDGKNVIVIETTQVAGQKCATISFDIEQYRGHLVDFVYEARATDVSEPPQHYNGVKLMVNYFSGAMSYWPNRPALFRCGSFDWSEVRVSTNVPKEATKGRFLVGLQNSTGKLEIRSVKIIDRGEGVKLFSLKNRLPKGQKAQYTERVTKLPRLRGAMSPDVFKPEDFDEFARWGGNLIRWQLKNHWNTVGACRDLDEWYAWLDKKLDETVKVLDHCAKLGIKVCVDLHGAPGARDTNRDLYMLYDKKYADAYIETWRRIVKRCKGHSAVWAYDLINEPQQTMPAEDSYLDLQYKAALAIRELEPEVPIVVASNYYNSPSSYNEMEPFPLVNIIYQVHMYVPSNYTHQGVGTRPTGYAYPGKMGSQHWDRARLKKVLQVVRDFELKYGARMYLGEFSAPIWAVGAAQYLADVISIAEEFGWDWTYHAFREATVWSVEHYGEPKKRKRATEDTDRKKVLLEAFKKNQRVY